MRRLEEGDSEDCDIDTRCRCEKSGRTLLLSDPASLTAAEDTGSGQSAGRTPRLRTTNVQTLHQQ